MKTTLDLWGSETPPKAVLKILIFTVTASLLCALFSNAFTFFNLLPPQYYLSLSKEGIQQSYLWQFFTFLFVEGGGAYGITFGFLVGLFMNMAVLWFVGGPLCEIYGNCSFYTFYFLCGLMGGCLGLIAMFFLGINGFLSGPGPCIFGLLVAWAMMNPEAELLFFFLIPIKAKWLVTGIVVGTALVCLSQVDLVHLFFYLGGAVMGYIFAVTKWDLHSPFQWMQSIDQIIRRVGNRLFSLFSRSVPSKSKIVDFKTGRDVDQEDDDRFMDLMLNKIGREGEKALSRKEKQRMREISERKAKK
jgi:membrane associated rhomboid family serine protease